jgi:hypothetical protein
VLWAFTGLFAGGLVFAFLATRGSGDGGSAASTTSTTAPSQTAASTPAGPVTGRDGQVIEVAALDRFEIGCRNLGLRGGTAFCRCARDRLGGAVSATEVEQAVAFFADKAPAVPPAVRAVLDSCTRG